MHNSPVETRSITPHSHVAGRVETGAGGEPSRPLPRVALHELARVFPHHDAQVVLRFGEETVGIDELEAVCGLERVPLVDVAVHEHGPFVIVRGDATRRTSTRVVDGPFGARPVEILPAPRDGFREPSGLLGTGGQAAAGGGAPHLRGGRAEDLVARRDRQCEFVQRSAEPFEE